MTEGSFQNQILSLERFSIDVVVNMRKVARRIRETLARPEHNGWIRSGFKAESLIEAFPTLRLKSGFTLLVYIYCETMGSHGRVVAVREDHDALSNALEVPEGEKIEWPPDLKNGVRSPMEAVEGDGTPLSYLSASILMREFREIGAFWHGIVWDTQGVLAPTARCLGGKWVEAQHDRRLQELVDGLEWTGLALDLRSLAPSVCVRQDSVLVVLHVYTELSEKQVLRLKDTYMPGSYCPTREEDRLATGGQGFNF